jgi:8-oxo-dGTP pyrophosphatase MutT (NUDIX family)
VPSWRPEALKLLEEAGFDGHVFVPESRDGAVFTDYDHQVTWENDALNRADVIVFWVPRDLATMPAFTTNVEFGMWCKSGKVVFGAPPEAPKNRYLIHHAEQNGIPVRQSLLDTLLEALKRVPVPAKREGGECEVPFHIWQTESFQAWFRAQKAAGNRLDGAKLVWNLYSSKAAPVRVFFWALHVKVWVEAEGRHKSNEVTISRPDISTVVLYHRRTRAWDSEVALVREFRSTVRNSEGFVVEAPGGSSSKPGVDPYKVAVDEVFEETGLQLNPGRVYALEDRQLIATMSSHKSHLFAVSLTEDEIAWFKSRAGVVCGETSEEATGERTTVEVYRLRDLLASKLVDWSMLGMIFRTVFGPDFRVTDPNTVDLGPADYTPVAKSGYDAYGDFVEWKNYAGLPMPTWDSLPTKIQEAWKVAAKKILFGGASCNASNVGAGIQEK